MEVYLDNAATTRPYDEVCQVVQQMMQEEYGNPSSKHMRGIRAEQKVKEAKKKIAVTLHAEAEEIIFTSGATESNNLAIIGSALSNHHGSHHMITTRVEHASVLEPFAFLESRGYEITYLPVDTCGRLSCQALQDAMRPDTELVSVMMVNNEVGAINDLEAIEHIVHDINPQAKIHVDAVQAYGKYELFPRKWNIDFLTASAHKFHGPKGVGFLYARKGTKCSPLIFGGGQQSGMRSGTENTPGIVGMATAAQMIYDDLPQKKQRMYQLKKSLIDGLTEIEGVVIHGIEGISIEDTAPHIISAGFKGIRSEVLLNALSEKEIYVSSGSACSSHHPDLSGTLKAMSVSNDYLDATLRFSISDMTSEQDISYALEAIREILPMLRRFRRH